MGLPKQEEEVAWVSSNQLLQLHAELALEAADVLKMAPEWLRKCVIHVRQDPVLGRCSWEEQSSVCKEIQTNKKNAATFHPWHRTQMRSNICAMVKGYHANSTTRYKRLEGMITIEYRHRVPLEHDLLVRLLLAMYI